MEYLMKIIIVLTLFGVVFLQTAGDFAIHEGRKKAWHRWKGLSLFILGMLPLILWLMQDDPVLLWDYVASIIFPYLTCRWFWFDILMNERLEQPIDFIGSTSGYSRVIHWIVRKIMPRQNPIGYLWIRFLVYVLYHVSWIVEWWPGHYLLHL